MLLFKPTKDEIEKATKYNSVQPIDNKKVQHQFSIEHQISENRFLIKYLYQPNWVEIYKGDSNAITWTSDKTGKYANFKIYAQIDNGTIGIINLVHQV